MADLPINPNNREEMYLSSMAGLSEDVPACPYSRKEAYLAAATERVNDLAEEVEQLKNNPDVVDIVTTKADLDAYDTSTLTDKDIIRVLVDNTHNDLSTYYRWNASTSSFDYVGIVNNYVYEQFTFTLVDNTTVTKNIAVQTTLGA